jgi:Anti-sigma factor NepR
VRKPTKSNNSTVTVAGIKVFETPGLQHPAGSAAAHEKSGGCCPKNAGSKPEISDQIGVQLRSVYDDILAQPVPGRFLDLLRQLEGSLESRSGKDGM